MARFSVNTHRFDPYRNFKFRVKVDNQYVAGLSKCTALKRSTEVTQWREGGDPSTSRQLPGKTKYDPVTLESGLTHDLTFETWANLVHNFQGDAASFDKIYAQYKLAPEVTRQRLYYETMERVLRANDKTVIEAGGVTPYLPLPEVQKRAQAAKREGP